MKSQPVARIEHVLYTEKQLLREQTLVNIIRLCAVFFCIAFWYGVYRLLKALL